MDKHGQHASDPPTLAAIDLGTNNCRLLIVRPAGSGFAVVDAFSRIVGLGQGMAGSGRLSEAAMDRAIGALEVCSAKVARRGVTHQRHVATAACRHAANGESFLARVARRTGLAIEIISAQEEARLAFLGCASLIDPGKTFGLVMDIGGGSTELAWVRQAPGAPPELIDSLSLPMGVVSVGERLGSGIPDRQAYETVVEGVQEALGAFDARHGVSGEVRAGSVDMLGTSGTVTTLCGIQLGLPHYHRPSVDGVVLTFDDIDATTQRLMGLDREGRAALPCVGQDRADLVLAGCAILDGVCRTWPVGRLTVADRGLREGILLSLLKDAVPAGFA